jgi:hypothetical protein
MQVLAEREIHAFLVKSPRGIRYEIREEHIGSLKAALEAAGLVYHMHAPTYIEAGTLTIHVKNVKTDEDEVAGKPVMVVSSETTLKGTKKTEAVAKANAFLDAVIAIPPTGGRRRTRRTRRHVRRRVARRHTRKQ